MQLSKPGFFKRTWKASAVGLLVAASVGLGVRHWCFARPEHAFQLSSMPAAQTDFSLALYQSLGARLLPGHGLKLLPNGTVFDALVEQIKGAQSSIHVLMYIWEKGAASDRVVRSLVERAKAGVRCRIVVDDLGSPDFDKTVQPLLAQAGCEVRVFRPLSGPDKLARNHRKLIVVDGTSAVTGGFGIRDNWLGDGIRAESWRDTNLSFTGPAVTEAQQIFAENWQEAGGALLSTEAFPVSTATVGARAAFIGSSKGVITRAERLTQLMIASAQRRLWIANAYFVPTPGILELLRKKAKAGVDVRILAPSKNSDSKTAFGAQHMEYGDLLKHGIKVWEYTSSMMHAKTMVVDDELALVGSINLDPLSLNELEEVALVIQDRAFADQLSQAFTADCARSKRLTK